MEETTDVMKEMETDQTPHKLPKAGSLEVLITQYIETADMAQLESAIVGQKRTVVCKRLR